jgi:hypothetical protein
MPLKIFQRPALISFDLRAFALCRIFTAFIVLLDLCIRATDLEAHYTDLGVLPLKALVEHGWNDYFFSLHAINGLWGFQCFLFLFAAFSAICVLAGYRTRLFTFVSWVMMCSLHSRNPSILQGGDDLLRMILFWGMFIPWNRFYSIDGLKEPGMQSHTRYTGIAGYALMLQIAYVYFFSAIQKTSAEWHEDGTALYYALSFEQVAWSWTSSLYYYPELLKRLTHLALYVELCAPLLFFIPWKNNGFRLAGIVLLVGLHTGIMSLLFVGLFSLIGISAQVSMLPGFVMDRFDRITARFRQRVKNIFLPIAPEAFAATTADSPLKVLLVGGLLLYVSVWNAGNAPQIRFTVNPSVRWVGYLLRLDQNWGVFAPGVIKDDGWYVLVGTTRDGQKIDVYREGKPVSYQKPESVVAEIKNDRWRKYGEQMIMSYNMWMRGYYCNYVMRKWNASHPGRLITQLEVVYVMEFSKPDYEAEFPTRESLWTCGEAF